MEVAGQLELFVWVGRNSTKLVHTDDVVFSSPLLFDHHERKKSYSLFLVEKNMNQQKRIAAVSASLPGYTRLAWLFVTPRRSHRLWFLNLVYSVKMTCLMMSLAWRSSRTFLSNG